MANWFYVRDGKQTGPIGVESLRRMIGSGEIKPSDLVWREGMADWKAVSTLTELAAEPAAPAADPNNPYAAPATTWTAPQAHESGLLTEHIQPGSDPLDAGACISWSWQLVKSNFGLILLTGLVYALVGGVADFSLSILVEGLSRATGTRPFEVINVGDLTYQLPNGFGVAHQLISQVLSMFLSLGTARIGLNIASGKTASVGMLFGEGQKLLRAIGASILYGLMVFFGLLFFLVPGIYLALRFGQYLNAIVDRDLGVIDSLKYSSKITEGNRLNLLVLGIFSFLIVLAGVIALIVGLIVAIPIVWVAGFVAYRWLQYGRQSISGISLS